MSDNEPMNPPDTDPLSPADTSSMDFADQPTDVVTEDTSSSSTSSDTDDPENMLSGIQLIGERRGPIKPVRIGFIPPARRSSTGTSAAAMTDDDDESSDTGSLSVSESDVMRLAEARMKKNPIVPLVQSNYESDEDDTDRSVSVSASASALMPPPPVPVDAAAEADQMSAVENEDEDAASDAAEVSVSSSASSRQVTVASKRATTVLGSQESLFSAVGHVSQGQSQRSARLRTSTPGVTLGRESQLLTSSQLDVSAIPHTSFSTSLPSSTEGQADESTRGLSSSSGNRPERPRKSLIVQRRLTFDGTVKSSEEDVGEPSESGLQSIAEESPMETSNTGTLSFIEENTDEPIVPVTTAPTEAVDEEEQNTSDILESEQGGDDEEQPNVSDFLESEQEEGDEEEEEVDPSESQYSTAGVSTGTRAETASTISTETERDFMRRLAIAEEYSQSQNLQALDEFPVDSLATTAIRPNNMQTMQGPNLQPVVAFTKNDRKLAEAHKKKVAEERAASSSQRPGASAAAEDSPASEGRLEVGKRFVRKRKTTSGTSSSQGKAPSEIYGSVISVIQMANSSQNSQVSRVGSSNSQSQQQQSQSSDSWRQSQPLSSIEEPPMEDDAEVNPADVQIEPESNTQIEPETHPDLIAEAPQGRGVVTPASNSGRKSSQRRFNVEDQPTPTTTSRGGSRRSLVEQTSSYIGSTESLFPEKIRDRTPKRQSVVVTTGEGTGTVQDEGGHSEGRGEKIKDRSRNLSSKGKSSSSSSPKDPSHGNVSRGGSMPLGHSGRDGNRSVNIGDHGSASSGADRSTASRTSRDGSARRERASAVGGGDPPTPVDVVSLRRSHLEPKSPRMSRRSLVEPRDSSSSDKESSSSRPRKSQSKMTRDDDKAKNQETSRRGDSLRELPREAQQSAVERASDPGVATLRKSHLETKSPRMSRRSLIEYKHSEDDDEEEQPLPHKSRPSSGNRDDGSTTKTSKKLSAGKEVPIAAQKSSGEVADRRRSSEKAPKKLSMRTEVSNAAQRSSGERSRDPIGGRGSTAGSQSSHRSGRSANRPVESSSSDNDDGFFSPQKSRLLPLPASVAASRAAERSSSELEVTERSRPSRRPKRIKSQIVEAKAATERISNEGSNLTAHATTVEREGRQSSKKVDGTPRKSAAEVPATNESQSQSRSKTGHENDVGEGSQRRSGTFAVPTQIDRMSKTSRSSSQASTPRPLVLPAPAEKSARSSRSGSLSSGRSDVTLPINRKSVSRQRPVEDEEAVEEPEVNLDVGINAGSDAEDSDDNQEVRAPSVVASSSSAEESKASDEEEGPVDLENLQSVVASQSGQSSQKSSSEDQRSSKRESKSSSARTRGQILIPKDNSQLHRSQRVTEGGHELLPEGSVREKTPSRVSSNKTVSKSSTTKSKSSVANESLQRSSLKQGAVMDTCPSLNVARKSTTASPAKRSSQSSARSDTTFTKTRKSSSRQLPVEDERVVEEPEMNLDVELNAGSDAEDSDANEEVRAPSVVASSSSSAEESQASDEDDGRVGLENLQSAVATNSGQSSRKSSSEEQRSSRRESAASSNGLRGKTQTPKDTSRLRGSLRVAEKGVELLAKASRREKTPSPASNKIANRSASKMSSASNSVATETQQTSLLKKSAVKATRPSLNVAKKSVASSATSVRASQSSSNRSKIASDESRRHSKESTGSNRSVPEPSPLQTSLVSYSSSDSEENEDEVAPVATSVMPEEQMDVPVAVADEHYSGSSASSSSSEEEEPIARVSEGKRTTRASEDQRTSRVSEGKRAARASEDQRASNVSEREQTSGTGERRSGKATRPSLVVAKKSVVVSPKKSKRLSPRQSSSGEPENENNARQTRGSKSRAEAEELRKKEGGGRKMSKAVENVTRASNESTRRGRDESFGSENEVWDQVAEAEAREISLHESTSQSRKRKGRDDDSEAEGPFVPPVELRPSRVSGREEARRLTQSPRTARNLSQRFDSVVQRNQERQGSSASRPSVPVEPVASTSRGPRRSIAAEPVASTSRGPRRSIPEEPAARTSKGRAGPKSKTATAAATAPTVRKRGPKPQLQLPKNLAKVVHNKNCITEHIVRCRLEALDMEMSNARVREVTAHLNLKFEEMLDELQSKTLRDHGMFSYRELEQALWNRDLLHRRPDGKTCELLIYFASVLNHDDFKKCQKGLLIPKGSSRDTEFI